MYPFNRGQDRKFAKSESMPSAKWQMDSSRQRARQNANDQYLGRPPANDPNLFTARLVLPGGDLLPAGINEPGIFDNIKRLHSAYITNVEPNVLDIRCYSIVRLQQTVKALNDAIHDLRLSNPRPPTIFIVQKPHDTSNSNIIFRVGERPRLASQVLISFDNPSGLHADLGKLSADMIQSAETMQTLKKTLGMRVNFGRLFIRDRKKSLPQEIPFSQFVEAMNVYSTRGGAWLDKKLSDIVVSEGLVKHLLQPGHGIGACESDYESVGEVTIAIPGLELKSNVTNLHLQKPQLSTFRATRPGDWPPLNWTIVAPDREYDWNLVVDSWDEESELPDDFSGLDQRIKVINNEEKLKGGKTRRFLKRPRLDTTKLGALGNKIKEIRLKTSAIVSYQPSAYAIQVSITQKWEGGRTNTDPETSWGVEVYAVHWDESINYSGAEDKRKDWGEGLSSMWPEPESASFEERFGHFLRTILEIQSLLQGAGS